MQVTTIHYKDAVYPQQLSHLTRPPKELYCSGRDLAAILQRPRVAIVGSRAITPYGRQVTRDIAMALAEQGVVIVSGLAYGVDAVAHQAALDVGGITMAVLPSPVQSVLPAGNQRLARTILAKGGTLLSTYAANSISHKGNFVARNEYVAALSQVVIVTEAGERSGARHTAAFANNHEPEIPVYAVPGNLGNRMSVGTNRLIASNKATLYTNMADIFEQLGLHDRQNFTLQRGDDPNQQTLLDLLQQGISDGQHLYQKSGQVITTYNQTLTMLEISGKIRPLGANHWGLA